MKLKTSVSPRPAGDPDPESWAEVWPKINKHLMAFVVNFFGGLPDVVEGFQERRSRAGSSARSGGGADRASP